MPHRIPASAFTVAGLEVDFVDGDGERIARCTLPRCTGLVDFERTATGWRFVCSRRRVESPQAPAPGPKMRASDVDPAPLTQKRP